MRDAMAADDSSYAEFAAAITPRLFRSALLVCGDWHLAEDLVQTTLAKLYVAGRKRCERLSVIRASEWPRARR